MSAYTAAAMISGAVIAFVSSIPSLVSFLIYATFGIYLNLCARVDRAIPGAGSVLLVLPAVLAALFVAGLALSMHKDITA